MNRIRWFFLIAVLAFGIRGCAERDELAASQPCDRGCSSDPCPIDLACCPTYESQPTTICAQLVKCMILPPDGAALDGTRVDGTKVDGTKVDGTKVDLSSDLVPKDTVTPSDLSDQSSQDHLVDAP